MYCIVQHQHRQLGQQLQDVRQRQVGDVQVRRGEGLKGGVTVDIKIYLEILLYLEVEDGGGGGHEVAVGEQHPLGHARAAAGVHHHRHVLGPGGAGGTGGLLAHPV